MTNSDNEVKARDSRDTLQRWCIEVNTAEPDICDTEDIVRIGFDLAIAVRLYDSRRTQYPSI
jgi:hypothetical protein